MTKKILGLSYCHYYSCTHINRDIKQHPRDQNLESLTKSMALHDFVAVFFKIQCS